MTLFWQKTIHYRWQWQLKSSPQALWPYISDTQRFNQAANLPAINYTENPLEIGASQRFGQTSKFGISVTFEDFPFDWVKEEGFSNLRVFSQGPIARTYAELKLEPNEQGTLLRYNVDVTPANLLGWLGAPYQFGWEMARSFERIFRQTDEAIQRQAPAPFSLKVTPLTSAAKNRLGHFQQQLVDQGHALEWVTCLITLLRDEADFNLSQLRPYAFARQWGAPKRLILELFLSAVKIGLLTMQWDLICPLCRGAKASPASLDEVQQGVHCPTCNIEFDTDFARNIELTFNPHPQIRPVANNQYCIGGPMVTPHIVVHQRLGPGETRTLTPNLEPGQYRVRTRLPKTAQWLEVGSGSEMVCIEAHNEHLLVTTQKQTDANAALSLKLTNKEAYAQRIFIELEEWYADAVSAAQVTSLQHFRDLFSDEVLRPGDEIGVASMTILFSDLVGSTAMYNRWGDAPSYAVVREQFAFLQTIVREHEGAIVKTIGDAIMAAFADPAQAVAAAVAIQRKIDTFNQAYADKPIRIKLGVHQGPCIAVTLNGRLDYFGTTVNLAARLEGQSRGGDVVISEQIRTDPAVIDWLTTEAIHLEPLKAEVKGFETPIAIYRLAVT